MRNNVTRANSVSERKKSFRKFEQIKTKKRRQTTKQKKHSRTSPDVQFKEFSLTKKTRPKTDYEWIGKTI